MCRRMLPVVMVVLALLASSTVFAAGAPAGPRSDDAFLTALQSESGDAQELPVLNKTPILKHGTNCSFVGYTCKRCSVNYSVCTTYRCYSSTAGWHNDTSCTSCGAHCPI